MLNLDTHILIFALTGALRRREQELLEGHNWSISSIAPFSRLTLWIAALPKIAGCFRTA